MRVVTPLKLAAYGFVWIAGIWNAGLIMKATEPTSRALSRWSERERSHHPRMLGRECVVAIIHLVPLAGWLAGMIALTELVRPTGCFPN